MRFRGGDFRVKFLKLIWLRLNGTSIVSNPFNLVRTLELLRFNKSLILYYVTVALCITYSILNVGLAR